MEEKDGLSASDGPRAEEKEPVGTRHRRRRRAAPEK